ncbi:MAG: response regulator, partial [Lachnospiraceae bacterium]|nr:response regulator [Lachnospiraceae bacterium]
ILMDLRMPIMTGYEAADAIRKLDREDAQTIPIIAVSADAFEDDIKKCLDCGMNAHTAKPFDTPKILALLRQYLYQNNI